MVWAARIILLSPGGKQELRVYFPQVKENSLEKLLCSSPRGDIFSYGHGSVSGLPRRVETLHLVSKYYITSCLLSILTLLDFKIDINNNIIPVMLSFQQYGKSICQESKRVKVGETCSLEQPGIQC